MYIENGLLLGFILGIAFGISLMIVVALSKSSKIEESISPILPNNSFDKKVSPFVHIHKSLTEETNESTNDEGINRLKEKIESFKHRNRFYKS